VSKKIAVLILGYNHASYLPETFNAVLKQSYTSYDVYYIDNASYDNSSALAKEYSGRITLWQNKQNLGYTGGYNQALRQVFLLDETYDSAVLLNPDVVVDYFWLEELVKSAYQNKNIGLVQSTLYLLEDKVKTRRYNTQGNKIHFLGMGFCGDYRKEADPKEEPRDLSITSVSGASLLIKKEVYQTIGELDDSFFAYLEDQDYSWRALLFGYTNICSAASLAWHAYDFQKNNASGFKFFLLERNRLLFLIKYFSWSYLLCILPALLLLEIGVWFDAMRQGYFRQKARSYASFLLLLPTALRLRHQYQNKVRQKSLSLLLPLLSPTIDSAAIASPALALANRFFRVYYQLLSWIFQRTQ
jgi:GT2 family glycosyltransferase